nr:unnamed protein product [Spirometra erinaceieuropaei]
MRRLHHFPPSLCAATPRRKVSSSLHNLSHPGSRATDKPVFDHFVWSGMHKDLKAWTRACLGCQRNKVQRNNKAPIGTFSTQDARFKHGHLDILGPLPLSSGRPYLFTCLDQLTRRPDDTVLSDVAASTVAKAFLSRSTRIRTTDYHPAVNGIVEQSHRLLKASYVSQTIRGNGRTTSPDDLANPTSCSRGPYPLLNRLRHFMRALSPVPPATCFRAYPRYGLVRRSLKPPYNGPFRVISHGTKTFRIQRGTREEGVGLNRLKAAAPDTPQNELCGRLPSFTSRSSIPPPVYSLCSNVRDPQLRIPPHRPRTL